MGARITKFLKLLKYAIQCTINLIYDRGDKCLICDEHKTDGSYLCDFCQHSIEVCNAPYTVEIDGKCMQVYSAAYYTNVMMELVLKLKYRGDFDCGNVLASLLLEAIERYKLSFEALCFVPSLKKNLKTRKFNQGQYLCKVISSEYKVPIISSMKRLNSSKDQIGLNTTARIENIRNCFCVTNNESIKDKVILLIDDVLTTGATAMFCSEALKNNGAKKVIVLTAAKSRI